MAVVTGDRYIESLVKFVDKQAGQLIEGTLVLKLNPVGLHYAQSRLEALSELDGLLAVDYLRAYISDLGDHRALEQLRRILRLLTSLKVVSVLPSPARDPTPLSLLPFGRLKVLELRGCDLSTSAARGLLELRHTLEKIICHNSTDALRHVFASRIAEIKDSPQWNRLSFVSCVCNGLVLMDESLQLLPVVETLDLSRNKFTKVDNIRKCTKLKHLDLGFNHLRTISSFSEVSCQIVKLVLRNNALTTLRGIENLTSLEGLDLSYNVISNFSELEILAGVPSLQNLWLEGNPLCCARWYREQVFSFFLHPDKLKLDEKKISTREFWKSQIIIASRQKRPASFGFYSPAKGGTELKGTINTKRKKHSRLACIEGEEHTMHTSSDQESVSCENETQSKEENVILDEEAEIVGLMEKIELLKKERSAQWLQEFKDWLDQEPENFADRSKYDASILNPDNEQYLKTSGRHLGESSRCVSDSFQASGDESSTNILESDSSFADISSGLNSRQYLDRITQAASKFSTGHITVNAVPAVEKMNLKQGQMKSFSNEGCLPFRARNYLDSSAINGGERMDAKIGNARNNTIDDIVESNTPSVCPGSPPHYQEDILHRRQNLVEEFLQLSAESYSVASSDSHTSSSEDDFTKFGPLILEGDQSLIEEFSESSSHEDRHYKKGHEVSQLTQNGVYLSDSYTKQASGVLKLSELDHSQSWHCQVPSSDDDTEIVHCGKQVADWSENKNCKRKPKRRLIPLSEDNRIINGKIEPSLNFNGDLDNCMNSVEDELERKILCGSIQHSIDEKQTLDNAISSSLSSNGVKILSRSHSSLSAEDLFKNYFNSNVADLQVHETCRKYMRCNCIIDQNSRHEEIEVAVFLSSEQKLYVLLIDGTNDGSGISLKLIGCHDIDDVREISVGLGLQLLRLYIRRGATYLFTTRSIDKSRQLLHILHSFDSNMRNQNNCSMKSLEQVQVRLFEKHLCGGSKMGIFQYSMLLFSHNDMKEDLWFPRSLFVLEEQLVVCFEDFVQFGFLSEEMSTSPYYSLDSSCFITDISDMVIETRESWCVTLSIECATSEFCTSEEVKVREDAALTKKKPASGSQTWKLKWFSEDILCNFVALLKAIHVGMANSSSPLVVRCVS
ncbi:Serine/threonine-protein kinase 11-interacting protein [Actinidia chinensis var. chinensis]|uniref:Serine/threonine-protein kinase 11-interacting protein n=1 Tax=Actinidia chinensis var. chinensis TaxID=1590841 RepID=A0A2R6P314_ACTCC|nr:Serine/threonine-protein kinase 11-interacting protein [Actinidia chinensis var. chinensis]